MPFLRTSQQILPAPFSLPRQASTYFRKWSFSIWTTTAPSSSFAIWSRILLLTWYTPNPILSMSLLYSFARFTSDQIKRHWQLQGRLHSIFKSSSDPTHRPDLFVLLPLRSWPLPLSVPELHGHVSCLFWPPGGGMTHPWRSERQSLWLTFQAVTHPPLPTSL